MASKKNIAAYSFIDSFSDYLKDYKKDLSKRTPWEFAIALKKDLDHKLLKKGLRPTKQRSCVYETLLSKKDHPTADEILLRVRKKLPSISLATVYNCLETLVECALIRQVNVDRSPTRYCPNLTPHAHFKCSNSGNIYDLNLSKKDVSKLKSILPDGFTADDFNLTFSGTT